MAEELLTYTGDRQPGPDEYDDNGQRRFPYLPSDKLQEAVNLAIFLQRPLLLRGEPGCGKTRLAQAVAYDLNLPYQSWHIKSTSRARDGLYTYDAVARLHDVQLSHAKQGRDADLLQKIEDIERHYIRWGALGQAFRNHEQRTVVLIDEIDKADLDFPNDLLLELDEQWFSIPELDNKRIEANRAKPPIVIITSNDEKDLPDAFLRRCVFHYIEFPDEAQLLRILRAHYPDTQALEDKIIEAVIKRFQGVRDNLEDETPAGTKRPATSELLEWFRALWRYASKEEVACFEELINADPLPFPGVLVKNQDDYRRRRQGEN